tara:strand:+ start:367 stop:579 length:213 start_codon:yes stop_codon:yes gene_type:complete
MNEPTNGGVVPLLMNYEDVSNYFGAISYSTIKREIEKGRIPAPIQIGGRRKMFITKEIIKAGKKFLQGRD